jgi:DNA polymerase-3 subunit epsilon
MCTMALASYYLPGVPGRGLAACCTAAGIGLSGHHSALADAYAAAGLLARFRNAHRQLPESWIQAIVEAAAARWVPSPPPMTLRPVTRAEQMSRQAAQRPPLAALVHGLPRGADGCLDAYLGVLDRVLEDRLVSDSEVAPLTSLAADLGLTRDAAERAHRLYLGHVAAAAWLDRTVTSAERADLLEVAPLLDVPGDEALAILADARERQASGRSAHEGSLRPGDRVVFTGDMTMSRSEMEELATAAGLCVTASVSARTALVVAADPHSQSGKARQARDRGVRMATEQVFLHMLDQMQPSNGFPSAETARV